MQEYVECRKKHLTLLDMLCLPNKQFKVPNERRKVEHQTLLVWQCAMINELV